MRRPAAAPVTAFSRFRPFLVPVLFVVLVVIILRAGLDTEALRAELAEGRIDAALARLATAPADDLPPSLREVPWWPAPAREAALDALRTLPDDEWLEATDRPTFVFPLDDLLDAPDRIVLREAPTSALTLELRQVSVDLLASESPWPIGAKEAPMPVRLFPGARYSLALRDEAGAYVSLAAFRHLSADDARAAGIALATASEFGGDDADGAELLMALTALHLGLTDDATQRFRQLSEKPGYAAVAGQLLALTLIDQGLDRTASGVLRGVR